MSSNLTRPILKDKKIEKYRWWKIFWRGFVNGFTLSPVSKSIDLSKTKDIINTSTEEAIKQDWEAVGNDLKKAIDDFDRKLKQ